ncbi:LysR substrate-binding domain-containing protein [Hoeflea olei]|uniref:LysR substrate-binding domain-containing protein n=1 Tax=Hoeflea olei TaxID=1480615 RepID=UPI001FD8BB00|nr:LysR substrate-binding domain-containing protein [Hoeflea olei]
MARKIGDVEARLYATPDYLASIGNPAEPAALKGAAFIGFDRSGDLIGALARFGLELAQADFPILSGSHLVQWAHVCQGLGIGIMTSDIGDAEPRVVRVLPEAMPIRVPVWLVAHREVHTSRRLRLAFDLLARELAHG